MLFFLPAYNVESGLMTELSGGIERLRHLPILYIKLTSKTVYLFLYVCWVIAILSSLQNEVSFVRNPKSVGMPPMYNEGGGKYSW